MDNNPPDTNKDHLVEVSSSRLEYLLRRSDEFNKIQSQLCQTQEMLLRSNTELEAYKAEQKSSMSRKSARLSDMY